MARKILLADDSVTAQNMGRKILADAGYEVVAVNNGSAALKRIAEQRPDLIVLDVYMPGYSGLEVCQRLKEANDTARIPILLTVGKLEPFKPEEAKRVRADAFIVKPFEASELLSALTKLEDKIVPVSEGSKPGRFARAIAVVEEGRYVSAEEDAGWKNRINFPSKKKQQKTEEKEENDDPAIYNPVNKDLRTTVERKPGGVESQTAESKSGSRAEDSRVDLGALAPEGLPKDVTPEEIAALAAAAARVTSTVEEQKEDKKKVQESEEQKSSESSPVPQAAYQSEASKSEAQADTPATETKSEPVIGPAQPSIDDQKLDGQKESVTFASQEKQESEPGARDSASIIGASVSSWGEAASTNPETAASPASGSTSTAPAAETSPDEPVTMAAASPAEPAPARWTAVPVAVSSDEIALALEHEMQKASAAVAAAEAVHETIETCSAQIASTTNELPTPAAAVTPASPSETLPASLSETSMVSPAVREFEKIAASHSQSESSPTPATESSAEPTASAQVTEADAAQIPPAANSEIHAPHIEALSPGTETHEDKQAEEIAAYQASHPETVLAAPVADVAAQVNSVSAEPMPVPVEPSETIGASVAPTLASASEHNDSADESEMAATTAAAWASWRRIRGVGDSKEDSEEKSQDSSREMTPQDAAMAVAAGAEKAPEDASSSDGDSGEIASIVDSVLADLRPKIVAEISRKLGKKK